MGCSFYCFIFIRFYYSESDFAVAVDIFSSLLLLIALSLSLVFERKLWFLFSVGKLIYWMCVWQRMNVYIRSSASMYVLCTAFELHIGPNESVNINRDPKRKITRKVSFRNLNDVHLWWIWHFIWKQIICYINDESKQQKKNTRTKTERFICVAAV